MNLASLTFFLCASNVFAFGLGAFLFFGKVPKDAPALRGLKLAAVAAGVVCLVAVFREARRQSPVVLAVADLVCVASLALFVATIRTHGKSRLTPAYADESPKHLVIHGTYRFVRHPYYSSYLLTYVACVVASRAWETVFALVVMTAFYVHAARTEERKFSSSALSAEYEKYRATTGMFLPRLSSLRFGTR